MSEPIKRPKSPLPNLPGWARAEQLAAQQYAEQFNAAVLRDNRERESWRDTYGERADYEYHRVPLKSPAGAGESGPNGL